MMRKKNPMDIKLNKNIVQFYEFDLNDMIYNDKNEIIIPRIIIIAKAGSGKSWVVRDILYHIPAIPCGTVIAPTDRVTKFYDSIMPPIYIHHEFDIDTLSNIFDRQVAIEEKNEHRRKQGKKPIDPRIFFIMDDCMSSKKEWVKHKLMQKLMFEGRHYKIIFFLTMQYSLGISPELRSQFDFIFLLGEDYISNKKKLYDNYAGMFPSFKIFESVFDQMTDNYGCMVINNRIKSKEIKKKIFWYKAKKRKNFILGNKRYKKFHKKYYDPDHKKKKITDINILFSNNKIRGLD